MAQTTTTTRPVAKGTRDTWTIACASAGMDCSFSCTDHNQKELVGFVQNHLKTAHSITNKTERDLLGLAKTSKF